MWQNYCFPKTLPEALTLLAEHSEDTRIIAGGTDLILQLERGVRHVPTLVDVTRIPGLDDIALDNGTITMGPLVTHSQVVVSDLLVDKAFPLARACWQVGSPQIRNRGTIAGNLINASPAGDTITPLWALDASVILGSRQRGERELPFEEFCLGVRRTALQPDEMLVSIQFPALKANERGAFLKLGLRQAQAIAVVNVAVVLGFEDHRISRASIALGSVAPTIVRATDAEESLIGRPLTEYTMARASELAAAAARPIDDIRASADYRRAMVRVLTVRALRQLRDGSERHGWPARPVTLGGGKRGERERKGGKGEGRDELPITNYGLVSVDQPITFSVNGRQVAVTGAGHKTLLRLLREDLGLTGTKEGCAEGECGACTVWLDGMAVQSCLVPAPRVHGCQVVTIEGLAGESSLHPVQQAFIEGGAVQCGYCTPGMIMSAAGLLAEMPRPSHEEIRQALTGNLCRCTGYCKVVQAIERAAAAP